MNAAVSVNAGQSRAGLESHSRLHLKCTGRNKVCSAKSRKKVIKGDLVRNVYRSEPQRHFLVLRAQEVIGADAEVKQAARCDSRRIRIVVHSAVCRNTHAQGAAIRRSAGQDW